MLPQSWGYVPTPLNVGGLLVALGGQIVFGYFKYEESKDKDTEVATKTSKLNAPAFAEATADESDLPLLPSKSRSASNVARQNTAVPAGTVVDVSELNSTRRQE